MDVHVGTQWKSVPFCRLSISIGGAASTLDDKATMANAFKAESIYMMDKFSNNQEL